MSASTVVSSPTPDVSGREIHVEALLGSRIRDADGKCLGRIEEMIAELQGTEWLVVEYHVGPGALLERVVELSLIVPLLGRMGGRWNTRYRVSWNQLDLSDPDQPRLTVRQSEIERITRDES